MTAAYPTPGLPSANGARYLPAVLDPVLAIEIVPPRTHRLRILVRTWQLMVWMGVAISVLCKYHGGSPPPAPVLLGTIFSAPILVLPALSPLRTSVRQIRAARIAKPLNRQAMQAIADGDGAAAESLLRTAIATPNIGSPALAGLVHNLGHALYLQGEHDRANAVFKHAKDSGWLETLAYRRAMRATPPP